MRYRKKATPHEAVRFSGINEDGDPTFEGIVPEWLLTMLSNAAGHPEAAWVDYEGPAKVLMIGVEGSDAGSPAKSGDWLVKTTAGYVQVCDPKLFELTYEPVIDPDIAPRNRRDDDLLADVGVDGKKWAEAFMAMEFQPSEIDEGLMIGWFCNAIEAGISEGERRSIEEVARRVINKPKIFVHGEGMVDADQVK